MTEPVIEIKDLTKDYGEGRGIFDINLTLYKGEMLGFAGTNGSGKTTTIRNIMGFFTAHERCGVCKRSANMEAFKRNREIYRLCAGRNRIPRSPDGYGVFEKSGGISRNIGYVVCRIYH